MPFFSQNMHYLGHVMTCNGGKTKLTKVPIVQNWPTQAHTADVRAFLRTYGYYRWFIARNSKIAIPLTQLCSAHTRIH